jgi:molecular chaperone DnaK (HSP70)
MQKVSTKNNTPFARNDLNPNANNLGQRTTPSVVAFAEDGTRHVGDVAKRQVSHYLVANLWLWALSYFIE